VRRGGWEREQLKGVLVKRQKRKRRGDQTKESKGRKGGGKERTPSSSQGKATESGKEPHYEVVPYS
jgi:hypothetical protein